MKLPAIDKQPASAFSSTRERPEHETKAESAAQHFAPENFIHARALQKAKESQIRNITPIRAHISSSVRRAQGKKDNREAVSE